MEITANHHLQQNPIGWKWVEQMIDFLVDTGILMHDFLLVPGFFNTGVLMPGLSIVTFHSNSLNKF